MPRSLLLCLLLCIATAAFAADWPQWRGPERSGVSRETHLLKAWPEGGPRLLWAVDGLGKGYASVAVAQGMVYTTGCVDGTGILSAFDLTGALKWKTPYGPEFTTTYPGTRGAPTVTDGAIYLYSGPGTVVCCDAKDGHIRWSVDTVKLYGAQMVLHGICESPLVVGEQVICCPGGTSASIVALNRHTGALVWKLCEPGEKQGYNSTLLITDHGTRMVVAMLGFYVFGLDPDTGKVYWRYRYTEGKGANWPCFTPVYQDHVLYLASGKANDSAEGFTINKEHTAITRVWEQPVFGVHHGGVVVVNGCVYGTPGCGPGAGRLFCLDLQTGKVAWQTDAQVGYANLIAADGLLFAYFQDGTVRLLTANPKAYQPLSTFKVPNGHGQHWAHMALADGRLYVRHGDSLMVYAVGEKVGK